MDISLITDNWGTISTVGMSLLGGYAVKVKVALDKVKLAVAELIILVQALLLPAQQ